MQEFQFDRTQVLSILGAVLVLYPFLGVSFWKMNREGFLYSFLNFLGTFLLALSALYPFNLGIFIVEVIWCTASFYLCIKSLRMSSLL